MSLFIIAALSGYLTGALSFTRLVTRYLSPSTDLSTVTVIHPQTGASYERVPNATTASMALGWHVGCLIGLLDIAKAILPILIWRAWLPEQNHYLVTAVFVVIGNNWPVYYRFRGGSGLSAIYGGLLVVDAWGVLATVCAGFFVGFIILRSFMLAFLLPMLLLIPWFWYRTGELAFVLYALAVNLIYLATFASDVHQYMAKGKGQAISERAVMEQMPMGRGMLKILDKLGLKKR